jgi:hypothetical protein
MKKITLTILLIITIKSFAQDKMVTNGGIIHFEASIPLFEEVKASNERTNCILMLKTGQITCWMNIKDFKFQRSLMEAHFNQNYMESDRFPRAIFKGRIEKFDSKNINSIAKEFQIKGEITIHGRTKKIEINGFLKKVDNRIELTSVFPLNTDDFMIEIPFVIRSKISKSVITQLICVLH